MRNNKPFFKICGIFKNFNKNGLSYYKGKNTAKDVSNKIAEFHEVNTEKANIYFQVVDNPKKKQGDKQPDKYIYITPKCNNSDYKK